MVAEIGLSLRLTFDGLEELLTSSTLPAGKISNINEV